MKPRLIALHGWGLDARLWEALAAALPDYDLIRADRGYFGPAIAVAERAVAAIGHSLGAMILARHSDLPLVAINGFDRFAGPQAVAPRVLARMQKRFAEAPAEVLADFRARIGAAPPPAAFNAAPLAADLALLAEGVAPPRPRVLVLHGEADPLLPPDMREATFAGHQRATHPGGHLLPTTAPEWCAAQIRAFLA